MPADILPEIKSGQPVVRLKGPGAEGAQDSSGDEALTMLVNNRLVADPDTAGVRTKLQMSHGELTMQGSAASPGLVGRTIAIALDTNGVTKVSSELRIDASLPAALRDDPSPADVGPAK